MCIVSRSFLEICFLMCVCYKIVFVLKRMLGFINFFYIYLKHGKFLVELEYIIFIICYFLYKGWLICFLVFCVYEIF